MTEKVQSQKSSFIREGIRRVATGKLGSTHLPSDLVHSIKEDIENERASNIERAVFLTALMIKGLSDHELIFKNVFPKDIFDDKGALIKYLIPDIDSDSLALTKTVLSAKELPSDKAKEMAQLLFSSKTSDVLRAIISIYLRIRYETDEEYHCLLLAMRENFRNILANQSRNNHSKTIQIAEPFDGVSRSYFLTPLLAERLRLVGRIPISLVSDSPGPKEGFNLKDLALGLRATFIDSSNDLKGEVPRYGYYLDQSVYAPSLQSWIDLRKSMVKRSFLSTLEKIANPFNASLVIASCFHPGYLEKMTTICEKMGYKSSIIVRRGLEGTLMFSVIRPVEILASVQMKDGSYLRHLFRYKPPANKKISFDKDLRSDHPVIKDNVELIAKYTDLKTSCHEQYDLIVKLTLDSICEVLDWVQSKTETL